MATSFFGSLMSAWRRQLPRRAPGNSVRILLVVLSKPSVRMPRTRYAGSCWMERCPLKLPIGLRKGGRTGGLGVAEVPEHATTDNGREIDLGSKTATVLLVGQEIRGQGQTTPGEHRHQTLAAKGTDQAIEGHGREMPDHRTDLQTEATVHGQQRIAGDLRAHLAV